MRFGPSAGLPEAFCDANVLYPSLLRDLLIRLDVEGLCRLRWSDEVNQEWIEALIRNRGLPRVSLEKTRQLMDQAVPHARVTGYGHLMASLALPDPDDRHVLAASMHSGAEHLITFNLSDFPASSLPASGVTVVHPDTWLAPVLARDPETTGRVLRKLVAPFRKPPRTVTDVADDLSVLRLPNSAQVIHDITVR